MGDFDLKYAAYERAMQQNNYFGLTGEGRAEQFGRYAEGLQYDEKKAANKKAGREFARELAEERKALSAAEQNALSKGLTGGEAVSQPVTKVTESVSGNQGDKIKVAEKMRVGTRKTGFKYYLIDGEGQIYSVDKKAYNAATKGKMSDIADAVLLDRKKDKIPEKVTNAAKKFKAKRVQVPKHNYTIVTDPQAYRQQQADMYEKLWGNFSHPENTPLGTAQPTQSGEPKTWAKYLKEHGKTYTQPVSGTVEADRRAANIIRGNEIKHQVQETLSRKPEFNPANLDKWSGNCKNPTLEALNDYYRELEKQPSITTLNGKLDDLTKTVTAQRDKIDDLGKVISQQSNKIDDLGKTILKQGDEIGDLTKKLAKSNKRIAVVAAITTVAAGALGYLLGKSDNDTESKEESTVSTPAPETVPVKEQEEAAAVSGNEEGAAANLSEPAAAAAPPAVETVTVDTQIPAAAEDSATVTTPVNESETEASDEEKPALQIDKDGKYTTKRGDSFWNIAERYLETIYAGKPEKFENLPESKRDAMIQKECERIMRQNGYWYDENHNLPEPMLYQEIEIVAGKIDKAA